VMSLRKRRHKRKRRARQGIGEGQRKSNDSETDWRQSWLNIVPMVGKKKKVFFGRPGRRGSDAQATRRREGELRQAQLPGMTIRRGEPRELRQAQLPGRKPCHLTSEECERQATRSACGVAWLCAKRGRACLVFGGGQTSGAEEPDEGNPHVRICGGCVW